MNRVKIDRLMERKDALALSVEHAFGDLRKALAQDNEPLIAHAATVLVGLKDKHDEVQEDLKKAYEE